MKNLLYFLALGALCACKSRASAPDYTPPERRKHTCEFSDYRTNENATNASWAKTDEVLFSVKSIMKVHLSLSKSLYPDRLTTHLTLELNIITEDTETYNSKPSLTLKLSGGKVVSLAATEDSYIIKRPLGEQGENLSCRYYVEEVDYEALKKENLLGISIGNVEVPVEENQKKIISERIACLEYLQ